MPSAVVMQGIETPIAVLEDTGVVRSMCEQAASEGSYYEWARFTGLAIAAEEVGRRDVWIRLPHVVAIEDMPKEYADALENEY